MTEIEQAAKDTLDNFIPADLTEYHNQYLGFYDLSQHSEFLPAWKAQDEAKIEKILEQMGCDLSHGYSVSACMHAARLDAKVRMMAPRWTFVERTDAEWISEGMAVEDLMRNTGDTEMTKDMSQMNRRYNLGAVLDAAASKNKRKGV